MGKPKRSVLRTTFWIAFFAISVFMPVMAIPSGLPDDACEQFISKFLYECLPDCQRVEELFPDCLPYYPSPVPKTGQKWCYDPTPKVCDQTTEGQDGDLQKGVAWPDPRLTDNGDGTVTDNLTGLIWLKDANCIKTHYPEFDNDGTLGDGMVTWQHAFDFVVGINNGTYENCGAGYTDWRLPNVRELQSLIDYGRVGPALPSGHPFNNVQSYSYWSSSTAVGSTHHGWVIDISVGGVRYGHKATVSYVWCVRNGL